MTPQLVRFGTSEAKKQGLYIRDFPRSMDFDGLGLGSRFGRCCCLPTSWILRPDSTSIMVSDVLRLGSCYKVRNFCSLHLYLWMCMGTCMYLYGGQRRTLRVSFHHVSPGDQIQAFGLGCRLYLLTHLICLELRSLSSLLQILLYFNLR